MNRRKLAHVYDFWRTEQLLSLIFFPAWNHHAWNTVTTEASLWNKDFFLQVYLVKQNIFLGRVVSWISKHLCNLEAHMESMPRVLGTQGERTGSREGRWVLLTRASLHFPFCQESASTYISFSTSKNNTSLPDGCGMTCKAAWRLFLKKQKVLIRSEWKHEIFNMSIWNSTNFLAN